MFGYHRHRSTILLALFAVLSVALAVAALHGLFDPVVELLSR